MKKPYIRLVGQQMLKVLGHGFDNSLVVTKSSTLFENLANESWFRCVHVLCDTICPFVPLPSKLKVGQVMSKPIDKTVGTSFTHRINSIKEQLSCQGQSLGHVLWLQFAQFDENCRISLILNNFSQIYTVPT